MRDLLVEKAKARLAHLKNEVMELEEFLTVAAKLMGLDVQVSEVGAAAEEEVKRPAGLSDHSGIDRKETLKSVVERISSEHPEWTAPQIAEFTGRNANSVRVTLANIRASKRATSQSNPPQDTGQGRDAISAQQETRPEQSPLARRAVVTPLTRPANGPRQPRQFRLRDPETGLYLHSDLSAMAGGDLRLVPRSQHPWQGNEKQLRVVRERLPESRRLVPSVVENEDLREVAFH